MSEDKDDKPFDASEQKLRKAREKGDIPRSTELNAATMYLGAWLAFAVVAGLAVKSWLAMASHAMGSDGWPIGSVFDLADSLGKYASLGLLGLIAAPAITILAALLAQRSIIFSGEKLAPDIKRIDPFGMRARNSASRGWSRLRFRWARPRWSAPAGGTCSCP